MMLFRTALALLASLATVAAAGEPSTAEYKHLGAATCASSVCHGKVAPQPNGSVLLNEYRTWLYCDPHAKSYTNLSKPAAQAVAAKLGIAATSKLCLDCHTDNMSKTSQGTKFQVSDGVGCEACHGGSEKWIDSHAEKGAKHSDNVAKGMYPSEQPLKRAELCLSCHMGTRDKFTTHMIMGAGHPRLRFELQVYSFNQPAHVQIESVSGSQCRERKGPIVDEKYHIEDMNLWVAGQLENARRYLELVQTRLTVQGSFLPDFSLYDCFSCHHTMDKTDKLRWTRSRVGPDIQPGTLRLQSYPLIMLQAITEVLAPEAQKELATAREALVRAGQADVASAQSAAQKLRAWIDAHEDWSRRKYSKDDIAKVRKVVIRYASEDKTSDFAAAEQVVMGVESLSYAFGDHDRRDAALNQLYGAIKSFAAYDPAQFAALARGTLAQF